MLRVLGSQCLCDLSTASVLTVIVPSVKAVLTQPDNPSARDKVNDRVLIVGF